VETGREGRPAEAVFYATVGVLGVAAVVGAIVFALIILMSD
jgi:hypothetical protein